MGACKGQQVVQALIPGLEGAHLGCVLPQAHGCGVQQLGCAVPGIENSSFLRKAFVLRGKEEAQKHWSGELCSEQTVLT